MREAAGFAAVHLILIGTGFAALRGLRLLRAPYGARSLGAALGPALVLGAALVMSLLIVLLVIGVPVGLVTMVLVCIGCVALAEAAARSGVFAGPVATLRVDGVGPERDGSSAMRWFGRLGLAIAGAYAAFGAFALARAPTVGDDARIWSLKGLTLFYYHDLRPEIFLNPTQAGAHPVYPLFQPLLEALLSRSMASPQLRLYHTEVWLLFAATIWTAGYAIARGSSQAGAARSASWPLLALVAVAPAAGVYDVVLGDTDIVGSLMLGVGTLSLGLWLEKDDRRFLALSAVLLAAAANTKDEDLVGSILVLVTCLAVALVRRHGRPRAGQLRETLMPWLAAVGYYVIVVAPWRIWLAAHGLSDSVVPRIPHAFNPIFIFQRRSELNASATALVTQTLTQWGWLAAMFLAVCGVCLVTKVARSVVIFYLASVSLIILALLWLYTTTPLNLTFLLSTSMDRTVDVFMMPAALATAHLLATLMVRAVVDHQARVRGSFAEGQRLVEP